jgi:predicted membrane-bound spermidine synthase
VDEARTRRSVLQLGYGAAALILEARLAAAKPAELVRESAYNYIIVSQDGPVISFRRMENGASVSAIDLNRPSYQVIPYTKYLFAPSLVDPHPSKVLSIGLGAGAFNRLFNLAYPEAALTTVEIDPMIRDLAVELTKFRETAGNKVVIDDGRRYLRRSDERYDWIVIDAFVRNSQYPPHLATREFFQLVADHLTDQGILVINVMSGNKLYDCLVATIASVMPNALLFEVPGKGNVIVLARKSADSLKEKIAIGAPPAAALLQVNGVDLPQIRTAGLAPGPVGCADPLTDDFSPTEFLGAQWRK